MQVLDFFVTPWESKSEMTSTPPTTKQQIERINSRLDTIEKVLEIKPPAAKSALAKIRTHTWKWVVGNRIWFLPVIAILGTFFGGGIFKYWLDHKDDSFNRTVDGRIESALKTKGGVLATLSDIDRKVDKANTTLDTLQPFIHDVINHQFESASRLSPQAFATHLPAIKNLLAAAREQNVKIEPAITKNLTERLLKADVRSTGYWAIAAEFINYRSQTLAPDTQILLQSNLPNCTDHDPAHNMVMGATTPKTLIVAPATYANCRLVLDSKGDADKVNAILQSQLVLRFNNCIIVYEGGKIELTTSWNSQEKTLILSDPSGKRNAVRLKLEGPTLQFVNCLFLFSVHDTPPLTGQYLTRTLLAQESSSSIYQPPKG